MQRPCSRKSLSNQRTTFSGKRKGEECRSGDGHLEWPPRIIEFIHLRNVFQKEVITFSRLWEEEETRLWRSSSHLPKKISQSMRNMKISTLEEILIHLSIWIRNDDEEDDEAEDSKKEYTHETNKDKYSIVISWYCFIIFSWCILFFCINDCILLICMWWVSSSWCYTTLHCYLSNLLADILDHSAQSQ